MEVLLVHYKGPHVTSKGHALLLIPVVIMGKHKQANKFQFQCAFMVTGLLIIHDWNWVNLQSKLVLP